MSRLQALRLKLESGQSDLVVVGCRLLIACLFLMMSVLEWVSD